MLSVKEFLAASGLEDNSDRIKLVKHVEHDFFGRSLREIIENDVFDYFQAVQGSKNKPFHNCDVIVSFIGLPNNLAELLGVYRVKGYRYVTKKDLDRAPDYLKPIAFKKSKLYWYELEELEEFSHLRRRLITQWRSTRGWIQKKDLEIYEILPPVKTLPFPGYQDVYISFTELQHIYEHPRAYKDWKAALEANAGIYRILDTSTGEIYIGSAYGYEGLWGRWRNYAKNGHGGNKLLKGRDPQKLRWSIVRTLSRSMSERDVIEAEGTEKLKHGSRAHGLNDN